ncbi:MAG TPA: hypothetical protein VLA34_15020 [Candidatus Krumholzibacterium sp.]|nr:hypothetical protein [Candidatus Krumholzibacterium sp.]
MSPELKKGSLALSVVCLLIIGGVVTTTGSEDFMKTLPLYQRYQCAICHSTSAPTTGDATLNDFGTAFHANGDVWNAALAGADSDGDGYPNGIEIGDEDGDGTPTAGLTVEPSNPGDPGQTPSSVPPKTWGVIKRLFDE